VGRGFAGGSRVWGIRRVWPHLRSIHTPSLRFSFYGSLLPVIPLDCEGGEVRRHPARSNRDVGAGFAYPDMPRARRRGLGRRNGCHQARRSRWMAHRGRQAGLPFVVCPMFGVRSRKDTDLPLRGDGRRGCGGRGVRRHFGSSQYRRARCSRGKTRERADSGPPSYPPPPTGGTAPRAARDPSTTVSDGKAGDEAGSNASVSSGTYE